MENTYIDYDYTMRETSGQVTTMEGISEKTVVLFAVIMMLLLITITIISLIVLLKVKRMEKRITAISKKIGSVDNVSKSEELGVVFCKKCGNQYDVAEKVCSYCGEKR